MDEFLIMTPKTWSLETFVDRAAKLWFTESVGNHGVVIQESSSRVYINEAPDFHRHAGDDAYCDSRVWRAYESRPESRFFFLRYSDRELAEEILRVVADDPSVIIDDGTAP